MDRIRQYIPIIFFLFPFITGFGLTGAVSTSVGEGGGGGGGGGACAEKCVGYPSTSCTPNSPLGSLTSYGATGDRIYGVEYTALADGNVTSINVYHVSSFGAFNDNAYACVYANGSLIASVDISGETGTNEWTGFNTFTAGALTYSADDNVTFGTCIDNHTAGSYLKLDNGWVGGNVQFDNTTAFTTPPATASFTESATDGLMMILKVCE